VTSPRTVVIAGAGIGGLTAAIALARRGFPVTVLEQAERLEPIGAGIQLSPNASRVLNDLALGDRLAPQVVAPFALNVMNARSGRVLARAPLANAAQQYGAPFWVIHRGDLHAVLREALEAAAPGALQLGVRVEDIATDHNGVTVSGRKDAQPFDAQGSVLIAADGVWSALRARIDPSAEPRFTQHTAWRALVPADAVAPAFRAPTINLWLGRHSHLVHYPVRGGSLVNVVAIVRDAWRETGWSAVGERDEILGRFPAGLWHAPARELIGAAQQWQKWALYDCPPLKRWGQGPVTLLGDAAHPMLPYLAQGAAMAIEDAAVLAASLAKTPDDAPAALRAYEAKRQRRTARTQTAARRNRTIYHMGGGLRTLLLSAEGGRGLMRRYDWLYRWKPD
jgi:salicylate hydroxylase